MGFVGFEKFSEILIRAKERFEGFSKTWDHAQGLSRWEEAVGPQIAKHSRAFAVRKKVLWVEVDHPVWKSELHYRKTQILKKLNEGLKEPFEDLFFVEPKGRGAQE